MRNEIIALIHEHYDPVPKDWPHHRRNDWDDGTGEIADRVLNLVKARLGEHWLAGIVCNHEDKTDRATCACSQWRCDEMPSIGAAVDAWIEHALGTLALSRPHHSTPETK